MPAQPGKVVERSVPEPAAAPGPPVPARRRRLFPIIAVVGSLLVSLMLLELALRVFGFEYELRATVIQGSAPDAERVLENFRIDDELIWVPDDYDENLARALRDRPDIAFMGDSCTHLGHYHDHLMLALRSTPGGESARHVNLGVAGWSSVQGLAQMERDVRRIRPKIVTFYYGWNDHWLSMGIEDREILRLLSTPIFRHQSLRVIQLFNRAYVGLRSMFGPRPVRVPVDDFRRALAELIRIAREIDALPVLLTAPTSHERGHEPDYLFERWIEDLSDLVPLHSAYVEAVREIARDEQVVLCDLAASFDEQPRWLVRNHHFKGDGIHLLDEGDQMIAEQLLQCFADHDLLPLVSGS